MSLGTHWPGTKTILCSVVDSLDNLTQARYTLARQQYENHRLQLAALHNKLSEKVFLWDLTYISENSVTSAVSFILLHAKVLHSRYRGHHLAILIRSLQLMRHHS